MYFMDNNSHYVCVNDHLTGRDRLLLSGIKADAIWHLIFLLLSVKVPDYPSIVPYVSQTHGENSLRRQKI